MRSGRTRKTSMRWLAWLVLLVGMLGSVQRSGAQSTQEGAAQSPGVTDAEGGAQNAPGQYAQLSARITALQNEIDALRVAGRPPYFHRRRALGCAALVVGGVAVLAGVLVGVFAANTYSGDSAPGTSDELTPGTKALIGVPIGAGVVLIGGGAWALASLRKDNANQARIDALHRTQRSLERERGALPAW